MSVPALVAVWYLASILAIVTCKSVLLTVACPATLCATQLACAAAGLRLMGSGERTKSASLPPLAQPEFKLVLAIGASYCFGFLLTNAAIAYAAPSFVETIKSGEPLSTVVLAAAFLGERDSLLTLACLVPIVLGVSMASGFGGSDHFSAVGFSLALASNFSFSGRAVLTKALRRYHPEARASRSDSVLFYHVSRLGFWLVLPVSLLVDAGVLKVALLGSGGGGSGGDDDDDGMPPRAIVVSGTNSGSNGGDGGGGGDGSSGGALHLLALLLANGCAHALYNGVSFAVLSRVTVTTHAVLNIVRRVALIAVTAVLFGTRVSAFNWAGVALAVAGCIGFARSKQQGGPVPVVGALGLPLLPLTTQVAKAL